MYLNEEDRKEEKKEHKKSLVDMTAKEKRLLEKEKKTLNAERIYKILKEEFLKEKELAQLEKEFYVDDHKYWANQQPRPETQSPDEQKMGRYQRWDRDRPWNFFQRVRRAGRRFSGPAENREPGTI